MAADDLGHDVPIRQQIYESNFYRDGHNLGNPWFVHLSSGEVCRY